MESKNKDKNVDPRGTASFSGSPTIYTTPAGQYNFHFYQGARPTIIVQSGDQTVQTAVNSDKAKQLIKK